MGWVWINPACKQELRRQRLIAAADFLKLPGVILCGHPDRHVLKVELSTDSVGWSSSELSERGAFLKKEHRVRWRDLLASACAGFGFVSKSTREAKLLTRIARAGIPCPEVLA